jgi:serine protease Do
LNGCFAHGIYPRLLNIYKRVAMANMALQINRKKTLLLIAAFLQLFLITANHGFGAVATRENSVVIAARTVSPAVVNISSQYEIRKNSNPFSGYGMDPLLEKFFNDFFSPEMQRREKRTSLGSGIIIDGVRGFVLTNAHVIERATTINVALNDKHEFKATIVGMDPDSDLAVLKIDTEKPVPAIQMGNSDDIMIGESVIAIGNPFGFSHTVTTGVISAVDRSIKTEERIFHSFIQTDASINPGNSGGPLLNINGELIGINTAIYAQAQGIGFAIPINRAKRIVSDLITYGAVVQPWIGLTVQEIDSNLATYLNIQDKSGVMVTAVEMESPAAEAGIDEGDIIRSIDGRKIADAHAYRIRMNDISAGQTVPIEIIRDGKSAAVSLKAKRFPLNRALDLANQRLGIAVIDIDQQAREKYGLQATKGVLIVKTRRGSQLDRIGVRPGDIIRQIDDQQVDNVADFKAAMVKYRDKPAVVLLIQRDGQLYSINVTMKGSGYWNEKKLPNYWPATLPCKGCLSKAGFEPNGIRKPFPLLNSMMVHVSRISRS